MLTVRDRLLLQQEIGGDVLEVETKMGGDSRRSALLLKKADNPKIELQRPRRQINGPGGAGHHDGE